MNNPYIVGIAGGSGSGKTTFINQLETYLIGGSYCLISLDNYYKPISEQPRDHNGVENYDTLESINFKELLNDIEKLKNGETVTRLEYNFNNPNYEPKEIKLKPSKTIIIEGLFVFSYPALFKLFDLKIFIETSEHHRIIRRLERDLKERGYNVEQTLYWLKNHVEPAYVKYVLPTKNLVDIIVPNYDNFDNAVKMIGGFLKSKI